MNRIFQNKKLWFVLSVVLTFLILFYIFNQYRNKEVNYLSSDESNQTQEITIEITKKDSDDDGLKDWEEVLWRTDANNPDTDGDGMNDNDEILAERDPLIKGVGDINKIIKEKEENYQMSQEPLSQTEILAREVFTGYLDLKQNGKLGTKEQDKFIKEITSNSLDFKTDIQYVTLKDLRVTLDTSTESLQKYSNELKSVFLSIPELRDDNIILKEALDFNSQEKLEEIKSNIIFYKIIINNLTKIEVPIILKQRHLNLINSFNKLVGNIEQMSQVFRDPVLALIGVKQYYETAIEIAMASAEIGEYFIQNNIIF